MCKQAYMQDTVQSYLQLWEDVHSVTDTYRVLQSVPWEKSQVIQELKQNKKYSRNKLSAYCSLLVSSLVMSFLSPSASLALFVTIWHLSLFSPSPSPPLSLCNYWLPLLWLSPSLAFSLLQSDRQIRVSSLLLPPPPPFLSLLPSHLCVHALWIRLVLLYLQACQVNNTQIQTIPCMMLQLQNHCSGSLPLFLFYYTVFTSFKGRKCQKETTTRYIHNTFFERKIK